MPSPSLLQRLKERKLVQWALAYLAGAFVVFQLVDALEGALGLTPTIERGILVIVGIGFFVTLILAWYHGVKGRQRVSGPELLMVAALLVVAGAALTLLRPQNDGFSPVGLEGDDRPGIAVFPCENWSPDPDDAYFASGIHDEILFHLQKISSLRSIGRESMEWYRANPLPMRQIAQELGVGFLGECSVLKDVERNQIRLTFQLLDGNSATQIWAGSYDEDLTARSIFDIHTDVARQVAHAVGAALTPEEREWMEARPTDNGEAYELYFLGRYQWSKRTEEGHDAAVGYFQRAIALDPNFALAHAGLADCYTTFPFHSARGDPKGMFALGEQAAEVALSIDPNMAEAHASLGYLRLIARRDWVGAEEELRHAIALDPSYPTAHHWLADLLSFSGRFDEALAEERRALELDPLSWISNWTLGHKLFFDRQYEAAIRQYERTLDLYPENPVTWLSLAFVLTLSDSVTYSSRAFRRWAASEGIDSATAEIFASRTSAYHRTAVSDALPVEYDTVGGITPVTRAMLAALVGDEAKVIDWLEQAYQQGWPEALTIAVYPMFDPLRSHPRFQALLERERDDGER